MNEKPTAPELNRLVINRSKILNSVWFAWLGAEPLSTSEMQDHQTAAGYSPMGYGFYNLKAVQQSDGLWLTTWSCAKSCD